MASVPSATSLAPGGSGLAGGKIFADRKATRSWLLEHRVEVPPRALVRVETIKLRRGRRLTLRIHAGQTVYFAKCYRPKRGRSVRKKYERLADALARIRGLSFPALAAGDEKRGILLWEAFRGAPLLAAPGGVAVMRRRLGQVRRLGGILARVHARRGPRFRPWGAEEEVETLRLRLEDAPRESHKLLDELARRLPKSARARLIHRDFYAEQVLVSRGSGARSGAIAILDWDDAALGPPALDVGNALAHLELLGVRHPRWKSLLPGVRRAFLAGYRSGGSELS